MWTSTAKHTRQSSRFTSTTNTSSIRFDCKSILFCRFLWNVTVSTVYRANFILLQITNRSKSSGRLAWIHWTRCKYCARCNDSIAWQTFHLFVVNGHHHFIPIRTGYVLIFKKKFSFEHEILPKRMKNKRVSSFEHFFFRIVLS